MPTTVSAGLTLCVTAALLRSIGRAKFSLGLVSLPLAAAVTVRWEQVWLFVAILIVAVWLYRPSRAALKIGIILVLVLSPAALWSLRTVAAEQAIWPGNLWEPGRPAGAIKFFKASALTQEVVKAFQWPILGRKYSNIASRFPYSAIPSTLDTPRLHGLMRDLSGVPNGEPVPTHIDQGFQSEAEHFQQTQPIHAYLAVPAIRAWFMWTGRDKFPKSGWQKLGAPFASCVAQAYKVLLCVSALLILCLAVAQRNGFLACFAVAAIATTIARTAFLVSIPVSAIEMRYLVSAVPIIEVLFLLSWPILLALQKLTTNKQ